VISQKATEPEERASAGKSSRTKTLSLNTLRRVSSRWRTLARVSDEWKCLLAPFASFPFLLLFSMRAKLPTFVHSCCMQPTHRHQWLSVLHCVPGCSSFRLVLCAFVGIVWLCPFPLDLTLFIMSIHTQMANMSCLDTLLRCV